MIYIVLFIFGAVGGAIMDGFHTHSGTTFYAHPWKWQMAWWVPLNFGFAALAVGLSHLWFDKKLIRALTVRSWGDVFSGIALFTILYFTSGFLHVALIAKVTILAVFALCIWQLLEGTILGLILAFATAFVGCLVEIILSQLGLFFYVEPDFLGIPFWLPALYIAASVVVGNLARQLSVD